MKILLALDGSASSDAAIERVMTRKWPEGSECRVITVNDLASKATRLHVPIAEMAAKAYQALDKDLREYLSESVENLKKKFGPDKVSSDLVQGDVKQHILDTAKKWGADLIVLGAPGGDGVNEARSSGLTRRVIAQAPCSVLVIRPIPALSVGKKSDKGQDPELESRFLVAVNNSTNSTAVLETIKNTPWPDQSNFQVITVAEPVRLPSHARLFKSKELNEHTEQANEALKKGARDLAERAARNIETKLGDEKVTFHALEGNARSLILQTAQDWGADTVLMGAEDENHTTSEFFFGSTADAVLSNANCSVQFIRATNPAQK